MLYTERSRSEQSTSTTIAGIYIHIPFCKQACHYCDFHFSTSLKKKAEMLDAIVQELSLRAVECKDEVIETIYFGGGTPSILTTEEIERLIIKITSNYNVVTTPEITLEANPDDLSESQIQALAKTKVNRLSIGIQSFFDEELQMMNRAHSANEAKASLQLATRYFDNVTIDLIYGIPNMSIQRWKENLQLAFDANVQHISSYALTVEPKTALEKFIRQGTYPEVNDEEALQHHNILFEEVQRQGFIPYEISNFGKEGYFSKHNTSYWQGKKYLGIGPSAHSFQGTTRSWNIANNVLYIKALAKNELPSTSEVLSKDDQFNEFMMTGLRTIWGINLNDVEKRFGSTYKTHILNHLEKHLLVENITYQDDTIIITPKGKFMSDGIAADFFKI